MLQALWTTGFNIRHDVRDPIRGNVARKFANRTNLLVVAKVFERRELASSSMAANPRGRRKTAERAAYHRKSTSHCLVPKAR